MQLGIREVASLFEVADKTVYRWVEEDGLPAHEVEGQHRFHRAEVLEWATTRDLSPSPEIFGESGETSFCSIAAALERGGVFYDVPAHSRHEAIEGLVARLPELGSKDRALLAEILLSRRGFGKPGGPRIAIPHVRHPIILDVAAPIVCLFFFASPVDFEAGEVHAHPIQTAFTLLTPSVRTHLVMLSRLAYVVHDDEVRAALERHAPAAEILEVIGRTEVQRMESHGAGGPRSSGSPSAADHHTRGPDHG